MRPSDARREELLRRILENDEAACRELFDGYRERLTKAVSFHMDRRLAARLDAADIVQVTLAEAHQRIPEFQAKDGYSFYAWIRKIAMSRLQDAHRRHLTAGKRSVYREVEDLSDESVRQLADQIASSGSTPSAKVRKREVIACLTEALAKLTDTERELLILKYVEALAPAEIAAVQEITERSVRRRHRHALEKLGAHLRNAGWDSHR